MKKMVKFIGLGLIFSCIAPLTHAHIYHACAWQEDKSGNYLITLYDAHPAPQFEKETAEQAEIIMKSFNTNDSHFIVEHCSESRLTPTATELRKFFHDYEPSPSGAPKTTTYSPSSTKGPCPSAAKIVDTTTTTIRQPSLIPEKEVVLLQSHCQADGSCHSPLHLFDVTMITQKNIFCALHRLGNKTTFDCIDQRTHFKMSEKNFISIASVIKQFDDYSARVAHYDDKDAFKKFYTEEIKHYEEWKKSIATIFQTHKKTLEHIAQTILKLSKIPDNLQEIFSIHDLLNCSDLTKQEIKKIKDYEKFGVEIDALHALQHKKYNIICTGSFHCKKIEHCLTNPTSGYKKIMEINDKGETPINLETFIEQFNKMVAAEKSNSRKELPSSSSKAVDTWATKVPTPKDTRLYPEPAAKKSFFQSLFCCITDGQ